MKYISYLLFLFILSESFVFAQDEPTKKEKRHEQEEKTSGELKTMIEAKNFRFVARSVSPTGGTTRQLTTEYDLKIKNDSAKAYLPFFGRAYVGGYGATDSGIRFDSEIIDYSQEMRKKNYEIKFEAKSDKDTYNMHLSITPSGYATLFVTSNKREAISYNGIIDELGL
jgi:hypothetical protein